MIVVIGHGPSLVKSGLGPMIDHFDTIIRCHSEGLRWTQRAPQDYGEREGIIFRKKDHLDFLDPFEGWLKGYESGAKLTTGTSAALWASTFREPVCLMGMDAVVNGAHKFGKMHYPYAEREILYNHYRKLKIPLFRVL